MSLRPFSKWLRNPTGVRNANGQQNIGILLSGNADRQQSSFLKHFLFAFLTISFRPFNKWLRNPTRGGNANGQQKCGILLGWKCKWPAKLRNHIGWKCKRAAKVASWNTFCSPSWPVLLLSNYSSSNSWSPTFNLQLFEIIIGQVEHLAFQISACPNLDHPPFDYLFRYHSFFRFLYSRILDANQHSECFKHLADNSSWSTGLLLCRRHVSSGWDNLCWSKYLLCGPRFIFRWTITYPVSS